MALEEFSVVAVYGGLREALMLAPVVKALRDQGEGWTVTTAAVDLASFSKDSLPQMLGLTADYYLPLPTGSQPEPSYRKLINVVNALSPFLAEQEPRLTLAAADGWVPAAAALLAGYGRTRLMHVGAGRPYVNYRPADQSSLAVPAQRPWVEQRLFQRRLLAAGAHTHLAATATAKNYLIRSGLPAEKIFVTGNPLVDATDRWRQHLAATATFPHRRVLSQKPFALVLTDREADVPERLVEFYRVLRLVAAEQEALTLAVVQSRRPSLRRLAIRYLDGVPGVQLLPPLTYAESWQLLSQASYGITLGGSLEEEGACFGTPVLVLAADTSWPELAELGGNRLLGPDFHLSAQRLTFILTDEARRDVMAAVPNPYGDGQAARRILQIIKYYFGQASALPPPFPAPEPH